MNKAVILASGGYDSTVCIALLESLGYEGVCLFFNYGQKSFVQECNRVIPNIEKYGKGKFKFQYVEMDADWLSNPDISGYFPSRNVIFLSYAMSYAEAYKMDIIVMGAIKSPVDYPDTSPEFIERFNAITNNVDVGLWCPLHNIDKNGVYKLGKTLGVDINDTWSCDEPDAKGEPCGVCGACIDKKIGISKGLI